MMLILLRSLSTVSAATYMRSAAASVAEQLEAAAEVAAVYGDGEGGKVNHSGIASIRHSK